MVQTVLVSDIGNIAIIVNMGNHPGLSLVRGGMKPLRIVAHIYYIIQYII